MIKGSIAAIVTPFLENGEIDFDCFGRIIEFHIKNGSDGIVVLGTTGEAPTVNDEETASLISFAVRTAKGRIPVIAGCGSNDTARAKKRCAAAERMGADAILLLTPYYNKTTQDGLLAHYKAIADTVSIPIILYNVPSRTGVNILPETCYKLSQIDNIVGIKEASGDISQVAKIANLCDEDFAIYSGNDDQVIPILSLGGKGVISVLSNIMPEYTVEMLDSFWNGDFVKAASMQVEAIDMIDALFCEVNPIPVKYALNKIGYDFGVPRLPLVELSDKGKEKVDRVLKKHM